MAEDDTFSLQNIIDTGLEKPQKRKVSEIVDESLEKQDPMSLTALLTDSGIIEKEEDAKISIFEESKNEEPKATIITASGTKTEIRTTDSPIDLEILSRQAPKIKVEKAVPQQKVEIPRAQEKLDEILVSALEKAKEQEIPEEGLMGEITDDIGGTPFVMDLADDPTEDFGGLDPGVIAYAHDTSFLKQEVIEGNIYETGWIEITDFESAILGKEIGEAIDHNLETEMNKLETKVHLRVIDKISTSTLEEVELENNNIKDNKGIVVKHINNDKTMVVTAEKGFHWVSAIEGKVISRTTENIDLEKQRVFYKVTISKPIDVEKLVKRIMDTRARGVPLYPGVSAGVSTGGGGDPVDAIQRDVIGVQISGKSPIKLGTKGYKTIAFTSIIKDWAIITNSTDPTSTIEFDILKSTLAAYPATTTIIANPSFRPVCTGSYSSTAAALTSWNVNLAEQDIVQFDVTNINKYTFASLFVYIESPAP